METNHIACIQGSDLLIGQVTGQDAMRFCDAVGVQQDFRCNRQRLLIMLLDTGIIFLVQLILLPMLLCRRVCLLRQIGIVETADIVGRHKIENDCHHRNNADRDSRIKKRNLIPGLHASII